MSSLLNRELLACFLGLCIGGFAVYTFLPTFHNVSLDIVESEKYHIHTDFLIQTNDELVELGTAELMTTANQKLHDGAHMHDKNGDVLHMHEENVGFVEFLNSLGITLTNECLTLRNGEEFCNNQTENIALYINDELRTGDIASYVPQDLDRALLYFGNIENAPVTQYLEAVPDDACIYSGSCPERGTAPPESCGLTCEL